MKKLFNVRVMPFHTLKLSLKMKVTILLTMLSLFTVQANTYSQTERVSLDMKDVFVVDILKEIESVTDYKFLFNRSHIDVDRKISIKANKRPVADILNELFKNTPVEFEIYDRQIILKRQLQSGRRPLYPMPAGDTPQLMISGTVTDADKVPLPGVNVVEKGTSSGTVTDFNGGYSLSVAEGSTLVFSYVGFEEQEIPVDGRETINIQLTPDVSVLDEVVVIGYGTTTRQDLTGSVSRIKSQELTRSNTSTFAEAIQGKVAGVRVNMQSGEPGASVNIEIRGANSINAASAPLYVIDGVPLDVNDNEVATSTIGGSATANPLATISPEDIESIEFLKDASATAIYGARGANGVIIVTTKSGHMGEKTSVNLNFSSGISETTKNIEMLEGQEYVNYRFLRDSQTSAWGTDTDGDGVFDRPRNVSGFKSYNWQDELFRTGEFQRVNLSMQGGGEKTSFSTGLGYHNQHALVDNNDYRMISARIRLDHRASDKLKAGISFNWGNSANKGVASSGGGDGNWSGIIQEIYTYRPVLLYNELSEDEPISLRSMIDEAYKKTGFSRMVGNAYFEYNILDNLTLRVQGGGSYTSSKLSEFYSSNTLWGLSRHGRAKLRHTQSTSFSHTTTLTYNLRILKGHMLKAMAGFETNRYKYENFVTSAQNFEDESTGVFDMSKALITDPSTSLVTEVNRMSFFGRVNYNIRNRYLFTGTLRADGSSNFGRGNRFAYFPSVAFAWRAINEPFMKEQELFSDLKLRLSYGVTGNDRIAPYQSLAQLSPVYYGSGGNLAYGVIPVASENPGLKWESTSQYDAGLDIAVLKNRVSLIVDAYYKKTKGMLLNSEVASQVGFINQWQNIGDMENKGIEFTLNTLNVNAPGFKWNTSLNIYLNRNKITSLGGTADIPVIFNNGYLSEIGIVKEGESLGTAYGYVWNGIYQSDDFTWQNDSDPSIPHEERNYALKEGVPGISGLAVEPGHFKYKDLDESGTIDADDRKIISNSNPKFAGGIANEFKYRNFSLSLFLEGVYGNDIFNAFPTRTESGSGAIAYNLTKKYWDNRWTPENPSNRYASVSPNNTDNYASTYYVEDGSYLRFKTLSLAYDFPSDLLDPHLSGLKVFATVDNVLVWTDYSGLDPDIRSSNKLLPGYDRLAYPRARTFMMGVNISF